MKISKDSIQEYIPYYLTQSQKDGLKKALKDFSSDAKSASYYTSLHKGKRLQGDGWDALQIIRCKDGERKNTKGILLSNTCGLPADSISDKIKSIRNQEVTSIFYLPQGGGLSEEYIATLDDIHTIPIDYINEHKIEQNLFNLSMFGFYLFLFKISVHFCRFHENVTRDPI